MELNKRIAELWEKHSDKTNSEKTEILNKELGKNWVTRTYQQRAKNYVEGQIAILKEQTTDEEWFEERESKLLVERKKNLVMKGDMHKRARDIAKGEIIIDMFEETLNNFKMPVKKVNKNTAKGVEETLYEYVVTDIQYSGGDDEIQNLRGIFLKIAIDVQSLSPGKNDTVRISFIGDDIDGDLLHLSQLRENVKGSVQQTVDLMYHLPLLINEALQGVECNKQVVFVPESNHGQTRAFGSGRSAFPLEDFGYIIHASLAKTLADDIFLWPFNDEGGVETEDSFYYHGHQGWAKSKNKLIEHLGTSKYIKLGHFHNFKITDKLIVLPTCKSTRVGYERDNGFALTPKITRLSHDIHGELVGIRLINV